MAINHLHRSWLAFAVEATQGALITDWDGDGVLVDHLEADPGAIAQSLIEDATLNFRAINAVCTTATVAAATASLPCQFAA